MEKMLKYSTRMLVDSGGNRMGDVISHRDTIVFSIPQTHTLPQLKVQVSFIATNQAGGISSSKKMFFG